jgi:hypothetical protein
VFGVAVGVCEGATLGADVVKEGLAVAQVGLAVAQVGATVVTVGEAVVVGADVGKVVGVHVWPVIVGVTVVGDTVGQAVPRSVLPVPYVRPLLRLTTGPHSPVL